MDTLPNKFKGIFRITSCAPVRPDSVNFGVHNYSVTELQLKAEKWNVPHKKRFSIRRSRYRTKKSVSP